MVKGAAETGDVGPLAQRAPGYGGATWTGSRQELLSPVRIVLADDRRLCRECLRLLIVSMDPAFDVVEAGNVEEVGRLLEEDPDRSVVLYNLVISDGQGIEFVAKLTGLIGDIPLVVMCDEDDPALMRGSLERGAKAFLPSTTAGPVLMAILRLVVAGGTYAPPNLVLGSVFSREGGDARAVTGVRRETAIARNFPDLTPRQRNVLALLSQGLSNREIADILSMCENTVKAHVKQVMRKLNADNRTRAALMADRVVS